jgi:hypothetical protein
MSLSFYSLLRVQGRCKPNAMELAPIAEAPPVLAALAAKLRICFHITCESGVKSARNAKIERMNPKKQLSDMPRRYWKYMTEKN